MTFSPNAIYTTQQDHYQKCRLSSSIHTPSSITLPIQSDLTNWGTSFWLNFFRCGPHYQVRDTSYNSPIYIFNHLQEKRLQGFWRRKNAHSKEVLLCFCSHLFTVRHCQGHNQAWQGLCLPLVKFCVGL